MNGLEAKVELFTLPCDAISQQRNKPIQKCNQGFAAAEPNLTKMNRKRYTFFYMTLNQSPENKSRFAEMARGLYVRPISHEEQKLSLDNLMENYQYLLETAPPSMVSFFVEFVTKTLKEDGRHQDAQKFARRVSRLNKKASVRQ